MSTARSAFTEAIEDHLALKKQNTTLESAMPLARYDVGDPLERYPGGPNRTTDPATVFVTDGGPVIDDAAALVAQSGGFDTSALVGPSPEQAMEAAIALETAFGGPFEPLNGMAPMLSLVEDIDEDGEPTGPQPVVQQSAANGADVLRFPGGVGPRDEQQPAADAPQVSDEQISMDPLATQAFAMPVNAAEPLVPTAGTISVPETSGFGELGEAVTGEQPVLVIDTDEPLAPAGEWTDEPTGPTREARRSSKPRFFGLGGRKKGKKDQGDEWFTDGPRDFNWD